MLLVIYQLFVLRIVLHISIYEVIVYNSYLYLKIVHVYKDLHM